MCLLMNSRVIAAEDDKQRQRDDREDRYRSGRSGWRDSDSSGDGQNPSDGGQSGNQDEIDDGDEIQSTSYGLRTNQRYLLYL